MATQMESDRRSHQRYPLATSIQFYHGPSQRDLPGRCVNVSSGGMMMYVPHNTPVRVGQPIQLASGGLNRAEFRNVNDAPLDATIVRVDRGEITSGGQLGVGVRFLAAV